MKCRECNPVKYSKAFVEAVNETLGIKSTPSPNKKRIGIK